MTEQPVVISDSDGGQALGGQLVLLGVPNTDMVIGVGLARFTAAMRQGRLDAAAVQQLIDWKRIEELQKWVHEVGPFALWLETQALKRQRKAVRRIKKRNRRNLRELKKLVAEAKAQGFEIEIGDKYDDGNG